jgi:peptidoglycan/xylan/chitin deacetylase (PgdA/CDA1 family)
MNRRYILSVLSRLLKITWAYFLFYVGITRYVINKKLKNKTIVLTYHRILPFEFRDSSFSHNAIMTDPANFEMQLQVINKYFKVINTLTLSKTLDNPKETIKTQCLITFDDGWSDNYAYAFPLLQKYECEAVIFVPLEYVSSNDTFWQEKLGFLVWKAIELKTDRSNKLMDKLGIHINSDVKSDKQTEIKNYVRTLKSKTYSEIEGIIKAFTTLLNSDGGSPIDKHMSWDQLIELADNGITIGSHACSHKILTKLNKEDVNQELIHSKSVLEKRLQTDISTIAYPNGDYNQEIGYLAKKAGYKYGFGTSYGYVTEKSDLYNLERININDEVASNKPLFLATIAGLY